MAFPPTREAYEALINEVKSLKEELRLVRNEKKETSRPAAEVGLQPKTSEATRKSWADIYNKTTALRKHIKLMGQKVVTDDWLEWRVKWGQRGAGLTAFFAVICWFAAQSLATLVFFILVLSFVGMLYYKNVSFVIAKRLLREMNVIVILVFGLCNLSIDIVIPGNSFSAILGFFYFLLVSSFVFGDAIKIKSRVFLIVVGILFVLININNIYHLIFGDWDQGVVLLDYSIQGNKYTFMKRSTKRSIFIQIVLFSMNGIYTIFKDRNQELMIFATGQIYRETGTSSKEVEDKQYSKKIKSENDVKNNTPLGRI